MNTGARPTPDPLAFLPVPDESAAPVRSASPLTISSAVPSVLQPGVYKGAIRVTGLGIVVMTPGATSYRAVGSAWAGPARSPA